MVWKSDAGAYRYGYNGQEHEDDLTGGDYDFGARIYDPRLGRWLGVDPVSRLYPSQSPYLGMGANPIYLRDHDGRILVDPKGNVIYEVKEVKKGEKKLTRLDDQPDPRYTVYVRAVYVFTNAGEKVEVSQYIVIDNKTQAYVDNKTLAMTYTCHGNTCLHDQFSVGSGPATSNKLLLDQGGFKPEDKLVDVVNTEFKSIQVGDIAVLFDKDGNAIHSFTYIGNGKYSTKNGTLPMNTFKKKGFNAYPTLEDIQKEYGNSSPALTGFFTPVADKVVYDGIEITKEGDMMVVTNIKAALNEIGTVQKKVTKNKSFNGTGPKTKKN